MGPWGGAQLPLPTASSYPAEAADGIPATPKPNPLSASRRGSFPSSTPSGNIALPISPASPAASLRVLSTNAAMFSASITAATAAAATAIGVGGGGGGGGSSSSAAAQSGPLWRGVPLLSEGARGKQQIKEEERMYLAKRELVVTENIASQLAAEKEMGSGLGPAMRLPLFCAGSVVLRSCVVPSLVASFYNPAAGAVIEELLDPYPPHGASRLVSEPLPREFNGKRFYDLQLELRKPHFQGAQAVGLLRTKRAMQSPLDFVALLPALDTVLVSTEAGEDVVLLLAPGPVWLGKRDHVLSPALFKPESQQLLSLYGAVSQPQPADGLIFTMRPLQAGGQTQRGELGSSGPLFGTRADAGALHNEKKKEKVEVEEEVPLRAQGGGSAAVKAEAEKSSAVLFQPAFSAAALSPQQLPAAADNTAWLSPQPLSPLSLPPSSRGGAPEALAEAPQVRRSLRGGAVAGGVLRSPGSSGAALLAPATQQLGGERRFAVGIAEAGYEDGADVAEEEVGGGAEAAAASVAAAAVRGGRTAGGGALQQDAEDWEEEEVEEAAGEGAASSAARASAPVQPSRRLAQGGEARGIAKMIPAAAAAPVQSSPPAPFRPSGTRGSLLQAPWSGLSSPEGPLELPPPKPSVPRLSAASSRAIGKPRSVSPAAASQPPSTRISARHLQPSLAAAPDAAAAAEEKASATASRVNARSQAMGGLSRALSGPQAR